MKQTHSQYIIFKHVIGNSSTLYVVARQQCKGNPLVLFHDNTDNFSMFTATSTPTIEVMVAYCYAFMATMVMRTRHNVKL
jgi:hypothetical protein